MPELEIKNRYIFKGLKPAIDKLNLIRLFKKVTGIDWKKSKKHHLINDKLILNDMLKHKYSDNFYSINSIPDKYMSLEVIVYK